MSQLQNDLRDAVALPITHISTYALTIEPGTPFFQRQERGLLRLPKDERVVEMLNIIPEILSLAGFRHYEISNFARPGCESEHNKVYWRGGDYLGVGAGAHSFLGCYSEGGAIESGDRWSNLALPQSYIDGVSIGESTSWRESLDQKALIFEFFYLGLRLIGGVSQRDFKERFGSEIPAEYTDKLKRLASEGFVEVEGNRIRLTKSGIALADSVFEQLG
jgi:oxygen-independent coproporphyrinogen-3 oxidase